MPGRNFTAALHRAASPVQDYYTACMHHFPKAGRLLRYTCGLLCSFLPCRLPAQVQINPNQTASAMAQHLAGPGVIVTNPVLTCAAGANGRFVTQNSNLGLDSGIVLTTGMASAIGYPEQGLTSIGNNTPGDPSLQALSGATVTRDACILEFDIVPSESQVKFDYIFASEEYLNSVCGPYNDAFAFFISGPGIPGAFNMARVPNTTIPVAVNSINNGIPGQLSGGSLANCTGMGPGAPFTQYYIDNQGGATVAYRGFTTVLTASSTVMPCQTYHLKMTIADAQNALYDSGVFIRAGSLQSSSFTLGVQAPLTASGIPFVAKGCLAGNIVVARLLPEPTSEVLQLQVSGSALPGTDYMPLPASVTIPANAASVTIPLVAPASAPAGTRDLKINLLSPYSCNGLAEIADSVRIMIVDPPAVSILTPDTTLCQGASLAFKVDGPDGQHYDWTPAAGLSSTSQKEPVATPPATATYTVTASLPGSGCPPASDAVTVQVTEVPQAVDAGDTINSCIHNAIEFDPEVQPAGNDAFQYRWAGPAGYTSQVKHAVIPDPQLNNWGWYYLSVAAPGCAAVIDSVLVNVVVSPPLPLVVSPVRYCTGERKLLQADGVGLLWYRDAQGGWGMPEPPEVDASAEGTQEFYVSQSYGSCESERVKLTVVVERCCGDDLFIPNAFSPNGDGHNDVFELKLDADSRLMRMDIFNRWGQRVYQQAFSNRSWDGTFRGEPLQPGSYFYDLTISCKDGRRVHRKGDILLVR